MAAALGSFGLLVYAAVDADRRRGGAIRAGSRLLAVMPSETSASQVATQLARLRAASELHGRRVARWKDLTRPKAASGDFIPFNRVATRRAADRISQALADGGTLPTGWMPVFGLLVVLRLEARGDVWRGALDLLAEMVEIDLKTLRSYLETLQAAGLIVRHRGRIEISSATRLEGRIYEAVDAEGPADIAATETTVVSERPSPSREPSREASREDRDDRDKTGRDAGVQAPTPPTSMSCGGPPATVGPWGSDSLLTRIAHERLSLFEPPARYVLSRVPIPRMQELLAAVDTARSIVASDRTVEQRELWDAYARTCHYLAAAIHDAGSTEAVVRRVNRMLRGEPPPEKVRNPLLLLQVRYKPHLPGPRAWRLAAAAAETWARDAGPPRDLYGGGPPQTGRADDPRTGNPGSIVEAELSRLGIRLVS